MEKKIIFATGNAGKMREIRAILSDLGLPVLSMKEAGVDLDIVEDGKTFVGTHGELLAGQPAYRRLYESQTGGQLHEEQK